MQLGQYGTFSGSFPLGQGSMIDAANLGATTPGKSCLWVQRNSETIWGGIIWTRLRDSDNSNIEITAQTFDSYFDRAVLKNHFIQQNIEQATIFLTLVQRTLSYTTVVPQIMISAIASTGIPRTILIPAYEFHYASEVIEELTNDAVGLEYTTEITNFWGANNPAVNMHYGQVGTVNTDKTLRLDFPGTVQHYTWPENAFQGGNIFAGRGGGNGNKAPTAVFQIPAPGYPSLWSVYNYPDIISPTIIKNKTQRQSVLDAVPVVEPTFDITGDSMSGFWQALGCNVKVDINDSRFPGGYTATRRLQGWSLKFADENNAESLTLTTDNGGTQ
jgi:hypothetical protein